MQRAKEKIEGLDPELTAGAFDQAANRSNNLGLDFYSAAGWGGLDGDGAGDYEGFARFSTLGLDYLVSDQLVVGANLNYEWSEIDFASAINGELKKQGLRADAYFGWHTYDQIRVEGLLSHAWLENQIDANFDKGNTSSTRWMAQGRVLGSASAYGTEIKPNASVTYVYEQFDDYATDAGVTVGQFDAELLRGTAGLNILDQQTKIFGLNPSLEIETSWDLIPGETANLADGSNLEPDQWGLAYGFGLSGQIKGFAPDYWIGELLNGAYLDVEFTREAIGREDTSDLIKWSLQLPLF